MRTDVFIGTCVIVIIATMLFVVIAAVDSGATYTGDILVGTGLILAFVLGAYTGGPKE